MHVRFLTLALALAAVPAAAQERPAFTLDEAIRLAEQSRPAAVRAFGAVRSANAGKRSAFGSWLPSVSANASTGRSFTEGEARVDLNTGEVIPGDVVSDNVNTGLSANVDLFTGFRRGAERRAASASLVAAEAGLIDARYQVALETTQEFLNVLAAEELLRVRQASVRRAEEQLKVAVAKLQNGSATRSDSLRSLVQLGQAQVNVLAVQAELARAEAGLGRLVGRDGRVGAVADSSVTRVVRTVDTTAIMQEALENSPRVRSAEASAEEARAVVDQARAAYWPTLNLGGRLGWSGSAQTDRPLSLNQQRSISLSGSWALFNGFSREENVVRSSVTADNAEADAADARRLVSASLIGYLADLEAARLGLEIAQTSVRAAEEDLRVQGERYRLGASTIIDVLLSQESLTQAGVDEVNARFTYLRAKAQVEALIGRRL
ncbi:MAG TPA: TolC family protein [Gemmatimonadales bacterium]|nr:TolC family protein [Gemmatimonadales bacterium]